MKMLFQFEDLKNEDNFNFYMQLGFLFTSFPIFFILFFIRAYYGKFFNSSGKKKAPYMKIIRLFLPIIPSRLSWIIQECPCVFITIFYLIKYRILYSKVKIILILPFLLHYIHRSFIFPFIIQSSNNIPLEITLMAFTFCVFNSLMINRSILLFSDYDSKYLFSLNYEVGIFIFILGLFINIFHDYNMVIQRKECMKKNSGRKVYILPRGFLFEFISCPNYFGELMEWLGFTLLSNTFSGFVFFLSTFANLFPRAIQYHKWYKTKFKEEFSINGKVKNRKSIIPFII